MNTGRYDEKQIISPKWIEEMTTPSTVESSNFKGMEYGYLWWIIDREKKIYAAIGNSGNIIYINPEANDASKHPQNTGEYHGDQCTYQ